VKNSHDTICYFKTLTSTNAKAIAKVKTCSGREWIWTEKQTAGRGRRGREWQSAPGNFYASVLQQWQLPKAQLPLFSFVAGLAVHAAITHYIGLNLRLQLKWPNDVILNERKVAGILLEHANQGQKSYLIAGFGVNLKQGPHLSEPIQREIMPGGIEELTGIEIRSHDFLEVLIQKYTAMEKAYNRDGFANVRKQWLASAYRLGENIKCSTATKQFTGKFETINQSGQAVIITKKGLHTISAGEIYFEKQDYAFSD